MVLVESLAIAVVPVLLNAVINKFGPVLARTEDLHWSLSGKLSELEEKMMKLRDELPALEKQSSNSAEACKQDIMDVILDTEDLLDQIHYDLEWRENQPTLLRKVRKFFPYDKSDRLKTHGKIASIERKINRIKLHSESRGTPDQDTRERWTRVDESSHFKKMNQKDLGNIKERADVRKEIVDYLVVDGNTTCSVVGMGGLGKTELVKMVCSDEKLAHLKVKWAHVSFKEYSLEAYLVEILQNEEDRTSRNLTNMLQQILKLEKCLFVLDDVWDMHPYRWETLSEYLLPINKGNKILITTRFKDIAQFVGGKIVHLQRLQPDDCLSIILTPKNTDPAKILQIKKRCEGVPLAAITLSLMLSEVNNKWSLTKPRDPEYNIMSTLKLSYDHLETPINRCFAYHTMCYDDAAINEIDKERLAQMWMAQGFIRDVEEYADNNFQKLEDASFFSDIEVSRELTHFKVLKLLNDLVFLVSQDYSDITKLNTKHDDTRLHKITRHILQEAQHNNDTKLPKRLVKNLRTFVSRHSGPLPSKFKRLRVLDLRSSTFKVLPSFICKLKHLRYLDLSQNSSLEKLPKSIGTLLYLETLRVDKCERLVNLPNKIGKLVNLKHLYLSSRQESLTFKDLTSLQTLEIVGCPNLYIKKDDMKCLGNLRRLALRNLPNLVDLPNLATTLEGSNHKLTSMCLSHCLRLTKLPTWFASLTSLQRLTIEGCSGLLSLADENNRKLLPDSLSVLHIDGCSMLTERCRREDGEDWSKINHVKEIYLNEARIQPIPDPDESSTLPSSSSDCHELNRRSEIETGNEEEGNIQYVNDIATSTSDGHGPAAQASDIEEAEKDIIRAIPVSSAAASKGKSIMTTVDQPKIVLSSSPPKKLMSDAMKGASRALMQSNNQKAGRQIHGHEPAARASEIEETEEDTIKDHILFPEILGQVGGSEHSNPPPSRSSLQDRQETDIVVKEANRGDDAVAREAGKQAAFARAGESSADPQPSDPQASMRNSTNSTAHQPTINQGASLPHESNGTRFEISEAGDSGEGPSCVQQSFGTCQNSAAQLHYSNEEGSPLPHQTDSTRIGTPMERNRRRKLKASIL